MDELLPDPVHGSVAARWGGWHWEPPRRTEHFRRCSYCGSVHPDDLAAEPTWRAEWADQKYGWPHKFYVDIPNHHPDQLYVVGGSSTEHAAGHGWIPWSEIPADVNTEGWEPIRSAYTGETQEWAWALVDTRPHHNAKFYTAHLADPQISQATQDTIAARSGRRFEWLPDGRVGWGPA